MSDERYVQGFMRWSPRLAVGAITIGAGVLAAHLIGWRPGWKPIPLLQGTLPWAAGTLVLLGSALLLVKRPRMRPVTLAVAASLVAITGLRLLHLAVTGAEPSLAWLGRDPFIGGLVAAGGEIRMSFSIGATALLLALAVILTALRRFGAAQSVALASAFFPLLALIGYAFGLHRFEGTMAPFSLLGLVACVLATLGCSADRTPLRSFLATGPSGRIARTLALKICGFFFLFGLALNIFEGTTEPDIVALEAAFITTVVLLALARSSVHLERIDRRRRLPDAETAALALDLRGAWLRGEMSIVFQPQMDLQTGDLIGLEVLGRWQHPSRGAIPPDRFMKLAEQENLIGPLGAWVMSTACETVVSWQSALPASVKISINVSPKQIADPEYFDSVVAILRRSSFPKQRLMLEVTETAMMRSGDDALRTLRQLKKHGIQVAIDDFGTGYSSLSYLRLLPCDTLKIDQSFIREIPDDANAVVIAQAVIGLGRTLGLKTVAEGIETEAQLRFLRQFECDAGQGYLFSRPLGETDLLAWVARRGEAMAPGR